jgi:hypothetical protein
MIQKGVVLSHAGPDTRLFVLVRASSTLHDQLTDTLKVNQLYANKTMQNVHNRFMELPLLSVDYEWSYRCAKHVNVEQKKPLLSLSGSNCTA